MNQKIIKDYPTVSVIIPTYNRAGLLREAIQSVLNQTYQDFEIIVVDDGSTDNTEEVMRKVDDDRIIYLKHKQNKGGAAARNTGIKHAKGEYIAFLDSDDLWCLHKLEKQVEILERHEDISFVYSNIMYIDSNGKFKAKGFSLKRFRSGHLYRETLLREVMCGYPQTWLIRKTCFEDIGDFDIEFKTSHDRDMSVRLAKHYKMHGIQEPLTLVRKHFLPRLRGSSSVEQIEYYWFKFLNKLFNDIDRDLSEKLKNKMIADYYFLAGRAYLKEMDISSARKKFILSFSHYPFYFSVYLYIFSTLFGTRMLKSINRMRKLVLQGVNTFRRFMQQNKTRK
jgi:glycosyltransferase involved in cell wall biosynthesis